MRKYKSAPHPFVIEPPPEKRRGYKPGDEIQFGLTLIGRAIDYLPYFIYTFDELGKIGIRNLLRRLSLLYYFHCGGDPSEWDFKGIIEKAEEIKVKEKNLRWHDWERYSGRQDTRLKMGGFIGAISFEGNLEPFMLLIKAGEVLHVGKGTEFGLGKYEVKTQ